MQFLQAAEHRIGHTDHATLVFAEGVLVIADWEVTEHAPDADGRVHVKVRGWLANAGLLEDPHTQPVQEGPAHLVRAELRGHQTVTDRQVHVDYQHVGRPYPSNWDHPGYLTTITWARRVDSTGAPIPEDEI
ncbi:hypothetical protein ACFC1B_07210 [Streptomyces xiamenensis]|uniref:hypothetical protein n=1 Tax=Streptomyces xiamenensis TaxID=408015 RepID=UPI0035E09C70